MTVYVDSFYLSPRGRLGRMKMSHMVADTEEELIAMAEAVGVHPRHIQRKRIVHFDISLGARNRAVALGAIEVTTRELIRHARQRF